VRPVEGLQTQHTERIPQPPQSIAFPANAATSPANAATSPADAATSATHSLACNPPPTPRQSNAGANPCGPTHSTRCLPRGSVMPCSNQPDPKSQLHRFNARFPPSLGNLSKVQPFSRAISHRPVRTLVRFWNGSRPRVRDPWPIVERLGSAEVPRPLSPLEVASEDARSPSNHHSVCVFPNTRFL
jgi:hypothetical protein